MARKSVVINRGIRLVFVPCHPKASRYGYVPEHILIAERVFGGPLPPGVLVHHHNGNPLDNSQKNLVICENRGYHNFLHARMRAYYTIGDPNKRRCTYCKEWKTKDELLPPVNKAYYCRSFCPECERARDRKRKKDKYVPGNGYVYASNGGCR